MNCILNAMMLMLGLLNFGQWWATLCRMYSATQQTWCNTARIKRASRSHGNEWHTNHLNSNMPHLVNSTHLAHGVRSQTNNKQKKKNNWYNDYLCVFRDETVAKKREQDESANNIGESPEWDCTACVPFCMRTVRMFQFFFLRPAVSECARMRKKNSKKLNIDRVHVKFIYFFSLLHKNVISPLFALVSLFVVMGFCFSSAHKYSILECNLH